MEQTTLFIIPGACSFGSIVALDLLAKPYQIGLTTAEIRKSAEFLKINPLGKVGTLLDDGKIVYENLAIILYLMDKNPQSKIALPIGSDARIAAYRWLSYLSSTLHVAFSPLIHPQNFINEPNVEIFQEYALNKLKEILRFMDNYFTNNAYLVNESLSVVDAQAYGLLRWGKRFDILAEFKNILNFLSRMEQINAVQNALNVEQNKPDLLKNSSFTGYYKF